MFGRLPNLRGLEVPVPRQTLFGWTPLTRLQSCFLRLSPPTRAWKFKKSVVLQCRSLLKRDQPLQFDSICKSSQIIIAIATFSQNCDSLFHALGGMIWHTLLSQTGQTVGCPCKKKVAKPFLGAEKKPEAGQILSFEIGGWLPEFDRVYLLVPGQHRLQIPMKKVMYM